MLESIDDNDKDNEKICLKNSKNYSFLKKKKKERNYTSIIYMYITLKVEIKGNR